MGQMNRISRNNTSVYVGDDYSTVRLHETEVVRHEQGVGITLNSGGWQTATTKARMNQAASEWGLSYRVWQKDFSWYVDWKGKTYLFTDRMTLKLDGSVTSRYGQDWQPIA